MHLKGSWAVSTTALSGQESEAEAQILSDYCRLPLLKTSQFKQIYSFTFDMKHQMQMRAV